MTNKSKTLYTGVTNNLLRRVFEHKHKLVIEGKNPHWEDLSEDWFGDSSASPQNDTRGILINE